MQGYKPSQKGRLAIFVKDFDATVGLFLQKAHAQPLLTSLKWEHQPGVTEYRDLTGVRDLTEALADRQHTNES